MNKAHDKPATAEQLIAVQARLKTSEDRFRKLFDNLGDEVHLWKVIRNDQGEIITWELVDVNPLAIKAWNKNRVDVIGKSTNEIFGFDATSQFLPTVKKLFENGQPLKWVEYFEPTNQYLSMTSIPFGDDYFISTGEDITQRIIAEKTLIASEQKYRNIAENFPGMVIRYKLKSDGSDELIYVSKGVMDLYEVPKEDAMMNNTLLWDKIYKDDLEPYIASVKKSAQSLSLWELEHRLQFDDGRVKWIYTSGVPVRQEDGSIIWDSYAIDITEIKKSKEELKLLNTDLEKRVEERTRELQETQSQLILSEKMASLGVLTSGIAHEINNPLNFILGGYTALQNYMNEKEVLSKSEISEYLDWIKTGAERAASIVKSLNLISSENKGIDELCNIKLIIDNCLSVVRHTFDSRIQVITDYDKMDLITLGNVGNLHQAFLNILTNATEAIEKSGKIVIRCSKVENSIVVQIEDSGSGIPLDMIDKVMDPFYTTKPPGKGSGLGLAISKSIINQHGGELKIESVQNQGTTVSIQLPVKELHGGVV